MLSKRSIFLRYIAFVTCVTVIAETVYFANQKTFSPLFFAGWLTVDLLLNGYLFYLLINSKAERYHNGLLAISLLLLLLQSLWVIVTGYKNPLLRFNITIIMLMAGLLSVKTASVIVLEKNNSVLFLIPFAVHVSWVLLLIFKQII